MAYCSPRALISTSFNTVNENNERLYKAKEVVIRGLSPRGVVVASVEDFGMKEYSATELESVVRRGMAAVDSAPKNWSPP